MKVCTTEFGYFAVAGLATLLSQTAIAQHSSLTQPIVKESLVFEEINGQVAVEAEHFFKQSATGKRAWYLTTASNRPAHNDDADGTHVVGAGGGAYLESLPDTRHNHSHKLIHGENFSNLPGKLAILHYKVHFNNPGRYYVWVRAFSTGNEDNGLHVGIDGKWTASGQRLQCCEGKRTWRWDSQQRTQKNHCGEPHKIYLDVEKPGLHTIQFSLREDGFEFDKFLLTTNRDFSRLEDVGPSSTANNGTLPRAFAVPTGYVDAEIFQSKTTISNVEKNLVQPRESNGTGQVKITGERKQWHKVTLTLDGPYAHELDTSPNPFRDYRMTVDFKHESGSPEYHVPGYFAADGNAANSSAQSGTQWRAHLSPDKTGRWNYTVHFELGADAALNAGADAEALRPFHGANGSFNIETSDKTGRDLRAKGRLQYVNERYLKHAGNGEYFLKAGADAPETFLGYKDFDDTVAPKKNVPIKTWIPHIKDWRLGDPTWKNGKGKGMIGAINYLASKGCNVFSFLTYNAGGDGDNVWPFVARNDKFHYDCSKLDQWGIVFDHAGSLGHYLHFKMQETEMDDNTPGHNTSASGAVPTSLDGGDLGPERKLYCRELIARFSHELALNWNLGEENTQSTKQQKAMAQYIRDVDPYDHLIVVHTFPDQQDEVYRALIADQSVLSGMSLQNSHIKDTHVQVVKWVRESTQTGKPWVVVFDESGSAAIGQVPDLGYEDFNGSDNSGKKIYTQHEVRKQTLWGTLMGGGAGVEYNFGYKVPQNDLICEDWRNRDQSWDYCRHALDFFRSLPFPEMANADPLVGNNKNDNSKYCFARKGSIYVIYLLNAGTSDIDLSEARGTFKITWFNPRTGGDEVTGNVKSI
ncbi:MAG TPA: DUF5060 domain-containing protein, partial [Verrucomicrobiales bacterium]|nr:DUF5060 domain-containing protein [Verrucomicrobiales bacterium]